MNKIRTISVNKDHLQPHELLECLAVLKAGGVVVFPTDTVYGLACNAFHPEATRRVYELKGRHYSKPLPILLGHANQLPLVAKEILPQAQRLIDAFWPGALTLVFKTAAMALNAARGKETIAVRVPDHGVVRQILEAVGVPLAATSANATGHAALKSGDAVKKKFSARVDLIIDGGMCDIGRESTVVDVTHFPFSVLRVGAISKEEILRKVSLV